ncbi:MAG TPA: 2-dehydropantoate 2-reductase [Candidatus Hydrogenedentes bacterium]|mgnify:CR=1 FL=1|nr:2-dehydropantoate 2-reductase [Candidatus Hydrogenedentota bacterium]
MKIAVIGPGAMGCLFAARLAKAGNEVTLVDHRQDRATRLAASGISVETQDGVLDTKPKVVTSVPNNADLAIVLVKAHATIHLNLNSRTPVLSLQNGLGNVETLCSLVGSANLMAGVTSEAATLLDDGRVRHVAPGITRFGAWTSCPTGPAVKALTQAGFQIEMTESPGQVIWEKVAINAGINPVTALVNAPNGTILEVQELRQLMRDLVVEAVKVAATEGYRFENSVVEVAEKTCADTAANISSMLQDVRSGRTTEIDAISGEIVRRAQLSALPTPRTRVVWQLIKGMEHR